MSGSAPNAIHFALAELERRGAVSGLVTQNVDGLHARAGSATVIGLHGDLASVVCLHCGFVEERPELDERLEAANPGYIDRIDHDPALVNPDGDVTLDEAAVSEFTMVRCLSCGSLELKPDVVYFGEHVPRERIEAATALEHQSTGLLVVGSSLAVMSGYKLVLNAVREGKPVGIINGGPSRGDAKANWRWRTRIAPALQELLARVSA
jgi:NAD-dependent SIR2 family protein deacetylase